MHRKGRDNLIADSLSRYFTETTQTCLNLFLKGEEKDFINEESKQKIIEFIRKNVVIRELKLPI